jgi:glycosyltransferase involved in cell wall biosynthesis
MRILLSAYACEPGKGSEPGVGWNWAIELARLGHEVWVLTRENNRKSINAAMDTQPSPNLHFIYHDLPAWARWWKKGNRGVYLYYLLWQWTAYRRAASLVKNTPMDVVHHITFGLYRMPSFMPFLRIPFIFGPLGGGESAPLALRQGIHARGKLLERVRDIGIGVARLDPLMSWVYRTSTLILCKTPETLLQIPRKYHFKCRVQLEIGTAGDQVRTVARTLSESEGSRRTRVLFAGRLIYWKGIHLALRAIAQARPSVPNLQFTIVGQGSDEGWLKAIAADLGLEDCIEWIRWVDQARLVTIYREHDVLLFPSLHDSSGNVVLEALAAGLPVVCLDIGGPAQLVNDTCGRVVATRGQTEEAVVKKMAAVLAEISSNEVWRPLSRVANNRASSLSWRHAVASAYQNGFESPMLNKETPKV